jgi:hypothetical protein
MNKIHTCEGEMNLNLRLKKENRMSSPWICNSTFWNNQFLPQSCNYPEQKHFQIIGEQP